MSRQNIVQTQRTCASCFLFLATLSLAVFCIHLSLSGWKPALPLLPGVFFFAGIGWWALIVPPEDGEEPGGGRGLVGAGAPVPAGSGPRHHLQAGKDLPPSDKTHSWPKD